MSFAFHSNYVWLQACTRSCTRPGTGVGEDLEPSADPHVIAVARDAVRDTAWSVLTILEGLNADEFADLGVAKNWHDGPQLPSSPSASRRVTTIPPKTASNGCRLGPGPNVSSRFAGLAFEPRGGGNDILSPDSVLRRVAVMATTHLLGPAPHGVDPTGWGDGRVPATRRQSKPRFSRVNGTEQGEGLVGCRVGGRVDRTLTRFVPLGGRLLECLSCCLQGPNGTLNPIRAFEHHWSEEGSRLSVYCQPDPTPPKDDPHFADESASAAVTSWS